MSRRPRLKAVPAPQRNADQDDFLIEEGIDAIDQLATKFRQVGMIDSANALDEVFVRCLRNYVAHLEGPGAEIQKTRKRGNGDLN